MNDNIFYFTLWLLKTTCGGNTNKLVVLRNKLVEFARSPETKKVLIDWYDQKF
jgi:hypothetical protein